VPFALAFAGAALGCACCLGVSTTTAGNWTGAPGAADWARAGIEAPAIAEMPNPVANAHLVHVAWIVRCDVFFLPCRAIASSPEPD
jgi:hypothetical protein